MLWLSTHDPDFRLQISLSYTYTCNINNRIMCQTVGRGKDHNSTRKKNHKQQLFGKIETIITKINIFLDLCNSTT